MYYVYYEIDYDDYGFEKFDTEKDAIEFINKRIGIAKINDFTLICGQEIKLKGIEVTTKVVRA